MDMVVKDFLPGRPAVGLGDIQAAQIQPFAQQAGDSMDGSHHRLGFLFRECPDVCGMSPRNHERVATGRVPLVEKGDSVLVLVHTPGWQRACDDFAEGAIHRAIVPISSPTGQPPGRMGRMSGPFSGAETGRSDTVRIESRILPLGRKLAESAVDRRRDRADECATTGGAPWPERASVKASYAIP
jgi:hypothetical protein